MYDILADPLFFLGISFLFLFTTGFCLIGFPRYLIGRKQYIAIAGIFIAGTFAFFPLVKNPDTDIMLQIVDAVIKSGQMFMLNLDYGELTAGVMDIPQSVRVPYQILLTLLNLAAPVCTGVVILSLIGDYLTYWKIGLFCFQDRHVFSHLNEKTLALAKSMKEKSENNGKSSNIRENIAMTFQRHLKTRVDKRFSGFYIFCSLNRMEREKNPYYEEAKKCGFIIIDWPVMAVPEAVHGNTSYYLISENGSENTSQALTLMDKFRERNDITIYVMSNETETEYLLDKKMKELGNDAVYLHHINEVRLVSYDLLSKNTLFSVVTPESKKVSMLIVGSGFFGLEVLKNSLWCSRNQGRYVFDVTVIDKNIDTGRRMFMRACPDLDLHEYHITFNEHNIDADTSDLIDHLDQKVGCYNYIVIATNYDDTNIKAALDIRSWYQRKKKEVHISVAIRDNLKFGLINKLKEDEKSETPINIFPFACISQLYTTEMILENHMELMGICINEVYSQTYKKLVCKQKKIPYDGLIDYDSALAEWRVLPLQKKRSSMALALFIRYVLWNIGYSLSESLTEEIMQISEEEIERNALIEHERWNAHMLIEGYYRWPYEDFNKQVNQQRQLQGEDVKITARQDIERLHACITTWETIKKIDENLGTCFAEYDREFIRNIPDIISGYNNAFHYQYGVKKNS